MWNLRFRLVLSLLNCLFILAKVANAYNLGSRGVVISTDGILDSYDFVIVGGGTSGLTVADRLTENPQSKADIAKGGIKLYPLVPRQQLSL